MQNVLEIVFYVDVQKYFSKMFIIKIPIEIWSRIRELA